MRSSEFLIEYDRSRAAQALGDGLWLASIRDNTQFYNIPINKIKDYLIGFQSRHANTSKLLQSPELQQELSNKTLSEIEKIDPTPGKKYTQWVARQFALGNVPKLEDILSTAGEYLVKFDKLSRKKLLKSPFNDINSYKTMADFMEIMDQQVLPEEENTNKGHFKDVYSDGNVRIIVPEDEAAACFWGQGTRWCTAATQSSNYFNEYNSQGPMYILLPKNAQHNGEKYQLHFYSGQFMDEKDDPIDPYNLLTSRFPGLLDWFKSIPDIAEHMNGTIIFASDKLLASLSRRIGILMQDKIMDYFSEMETSDFGYYEWLRLQGYDVDYDSEHDWTNAPKYIEYDPSAKEWLDDISSEVKPSPNDIREAALMLGQQDGVLVDITDAGDVFGLLTFDFLKPKRKKYDTCVSSNKITQPPPQQYKYEF